MAWAEDNVHKPLKSGGGPMGFLVKSSRLSFLGQLSY